MAERKPSLIWDEAEQCIRVLPGMCPSPIGDDDGTLKACRANGHCGCDCEDTPTADDRGVEKKEQRE